MGTLTYINERIDHWLHRWSISLHMDPVEEHGGGSFTRDFEGKVSNQGMRRRQLWIQVSSIGAMLGNLVLGSVTGNFEK